MPHGIFHEVRKFLDNSSRENQNKYCWLNRFLQKSNLYETIMKNMSETCDVWSNIIWHKEDSIFQCCHKNLTQSSTFLTMAHISAIQKRTSCCFSITAFLILAILHNKKQLKSSKLAWQQNTIKTTNYKHELIPYFQGRNSLLLVRWGFRVRSSDAFPVAIIIIVIITFSWCTLFLQTGLW
jgi:hypothetical protein